jgi:hypothetical protein
MSIFTMLLDESHTIETLKRDLALKINDYLNR